MAFVIKMWLRLSSFMMSLGDIIPHFLLLPPHLIITMLSLLWSLSSSPLSSKYLFHRHNDHHRNRHWHIECNSHSLDCKALFSAFKSQLFPPHTSKLKTLLVMMMMMMMIVTTIIIVMLSGQGIQIQIVSPAYTKFKTSFRTMFMEEAVYIQIENSYWLSSGQGMVRGYCLSGDGVTAKMRKPSGFGDFNSNFFLGEGFPGPKAGCEWNAGVLRDASGSGKMYTM